MSRRCTRRTGRKGPTHNSEVCVTTEALRIVDAEFRAANDVTVARPTRLFLNLTEKCQLRCAHCITDAPARSKDGSAREMTRDVLDALAPHLAHVAWVGLVHAGEPMLAPMFEPFLEALAGARPQGQALGLPQSHVHLLTNGMAMTPERWSRVRSLGVTSLSVSMDGMSAQTNDVLRIGSSAPLLQERIAAICADKGAARVGISWVVTSANIGEIDALVRFAAGAAVDWLKLEEVFAANDTARALAVDRYALDVAVAKARTLGDEIGVPVLDHTRPLEVWRCRLDVDARMARRALLDDKVNRVELNPCRAPWDLACIEPNGDVRPMSFHHPIAGNLVDTPLDALFRDAPAFVDARRTMRSLRLCGAAGPTTCAPDAGPSSW
jgi:cyclomaltodextrinase / maltogenic alpha-amylase / neopullulanase